MDTHPNCSANGDPVTKETHVKETSHRRSSPALPDSWAAGYEPPDGLHKPPDKPTEATLVMGRQHNPPPKGKHKGKPDRADANSLRSPPHKKTCKAVDFTASRDAPQSVGALTPTPPSSPLTDDEFTEASLKGRKEYLTSESGRDQSKETTNNRRDDLSVATPKGAAKIQTTVVGGKPATGRQRLLGQSSSAVQLVRPVVCEPTTQLEKSQPTWSISRTTTTSSASALIRSNTKAAAKGPSLTSTGTANNNISFPNDIPNKNNTTSTTTSFTFQQQSQQANIQLTGQFGQCSSKAPLSSKKIPSHSVFSGGPRETNTLLSSTNGGSKQQQPQLLTPPVVVTMAPATHLATASKVITTQRRPGDFVWAQRKGFLFYPAKIISETEVPHKLPTHLTSKYLPVFIFGLNCCCFVEEGSVMDYLTNRSEMSHKDIPRWCEAVKEIEIELARRSSLAIRRLSSSQQGVSTVAVNVDSVFQSSSANPPAAAENTGQDGSVVGNDDSQQTGVESATAPPVDGVNQSIEEHSEAKLQPSPPETDDDDEEVVDECGSDQSNGVGKSKKKGTRALGQPPFSDAVVKGRVKGRCGKRLSSSDDDYRPPSPDPESSSDERDYDDDDNIKKTKKNGRKKPVDVNKHRRLSAKKGKQPQQPLQQIDLDHVRSPERRNGSALLTPSVTSTTKVTNRRDTQRPHLLVESTTKKIDLAQKCAHVVGNSPTYDESTPLSSVSMAQAQAFALDSRKIAPNHHDVWSDHQQSCSNSSSNTSYLPTNTSKMATGCHRDYFAAANRLLTEAEGRDTNNNDNSSQSTTSRSEVVGDSDNDHTVNPKDLDETSSDEELEELEVRRGGSTQSRKRKRSAQPPLQSELEPLCSNRIYNIEQLKRPPIDPMKRLNRPPIRQQPVSDALSLPDNTDKDVPNTASANPTAVPPALNQGSRQPSVADDSQPYHFDHWIDDMRKKNQQQLPIFIRMQVEEDTRLRGMDDDTAVKLLGLKNAKCLRASFSMIRSVPTMSQTGNPIPPVKPSMQQFRLLYSYLKNAVPMEQILVDVFEKDPLCRSIPTVVPQMRRYIKYECAKNHEPVPTKAKPRRAKPRRPPSAQPLSSASPLVAELSPEDKEYLDALKDDPVDERMSLFLHRYQRIVAKEKKKLAAMAKSTRTRGRFQLPDYPVPTRDPTIEDLIRQIETRPEARVTKEITTWRGELMWNEDGTTITDPYLSSIYRRVDLELKRLHPGAGGELFLHHYGPQQTRTTVQFGLESGIQSTSTGNTSPDNKSDVIPSTAASDQSAPLPLLSDEQQQEIDAAWALDFPFCGKDYINTYLRQGQWYRIISFPRRMQLQRLFDRYLEFCWYHSSPRLEPLNCEPNLLSWMQYMGDSCTKKMTCAALMAARRYSLSTIQGQQRSLAKLMRSVGLLPLEYRAKPLNLRFGDDWRDAVHVKVWTQRASFDYKDMDRVCHLMVEERLQLGGVRPCDVQEMLFLQLDMFYGKRPQSFFPHRDGEGDFDGMKVSDVSFFVEMSADTDEMGQPQPKQAVLGIKLQFRHEKQKAGEIGWAEQVARRSRFSPYDMVNLMLLHLDDLGVLNRDTLDPTAGVIQIDTTTDQSLFVAWDRQTGLLIPDKPLTMNTYHPILRHLAEVAHLPYCMTTLKCCRRSFAQAMALKSQIKDKATVGQGRERVAQQQFVEKGSIARYDNNIAQHEDDIVALIVDDHHSELPARDPNTRAFPTDVTLMLANSDTVPYYTLTSPAVVSYCQAIADQLHWDPSDAYEKLRRLKKAVCDKLNMKNLLALRNEQTKHTGRIIRQLDPVPDAAKILNLDLMLKAFRRCTSEVTQTTEGRKCPMDSCDYRIQHKGFTAHLKDIHHIEKERHEGCPLGDCDFDGRDLVAHLSRYHTSPIEYCNACQQHFSCKNIHSTTPLCPSWKPYEWCKWIVQDPPTSKMPKIKMPPSKEIFDTTPGDANEALEAEEDEDEAEAEADEDLVDEDDVIARIQQLAQKLPTPAAQMRCMQAIIAAPPKELESAQANRVKPTVTHKAQPRKTPVKRHQPIDPPQGSPVKKARVEQPPTVVSQHVAVAIRNLNRPTQPHPNPQNLGLAPQQRVTVAMTPCPVQKQMGPPQPQRNVVGTHPLASSTHNSTTGPSPQQQIWSSGVKRSGVTSGASQKAQSQKGSSGAEKSKAQNPVAPPNSQAGSSQNQSRSEVNTEDFQMEMDFGEGEGEVDDAAVGFDDFFNFDADEEASGGGTQASGGFDLTFHSTSPPPTDDDDDFS